MTVTAGGLRCGAQLGWRHAAPTLARSRSCTTRACRTPHQAMTAATPAAGSSWKSPCRLAGLPCRASACRPNQLATAATDISGDVVDDLVPAISTPPPTRRHQRHPVWVLQPPAGQGDHRGARRLDRGDDPRPGPPPSRTASLMSLRGRGLWLIGQLVDELRLAKARPGTPVILRRCIPRRLRRLGELRDGRVGINE
jgi:hypothetical protein